MGTDDGFKTIVAATGQVSDLDVANRRFTLVPPDGSAPTLVQVSDDTIVGLLHEGDIGGLNTTDKTLVVKVDEKVILLFQPFPPVKDYFELYRKMGQGLGMQDLYKNLQDHLQKLGGLPGLSEGFLPILPELFKGDSSKEAGKLRELFPKGFPPIPPELFDGDSPKDPGELRELFEGMFQAITSEDYVGENLNLEEILKHLPFDLEGMLERASLGTKDQVEAPEPSL